MSDTAGHTAAARAPIEADPVDSAKCVHELFEKAAATWPERIAIVDDRREIRYAPLNDRTNQLARYLQRAGVGPERLVGVFMPRSIDAVHTVLAVLKTGGGYVGLDPSNPDAHTREILAEAQFAAIVTVSSLHDRLPAGGYRIVCLDREARQIGLESTANTDGGATPDNIAFVTFTSGSTGRQKGVVGTHRGITNSLADLPFDRSREDEVCSLNSSLSFGFSLSRLFLPLFCGLPLVIIPESAVQDLDDFVTALAVHKVANVAIVTPVLQNILSFGERMTERLRQVRTVITGGSRIPRGLAKSFRDLMPWAQLLNGYAASELCGPATLAHMGNNGDVDLDLTAGFPFPNVRVYALDDELQPVAEGKAGDLYLGAGHLARGYLNRPDLTASRFVADPFSSPPGGRLFRTGDVGVCMGNRSVKVLGRADRTSKIRGFRVDLDDVEDTLLRHDEIRQAAVIAEDRPEGIRIAAYVSCRAESKLTVGGLREFLRARLPDYMIPTAMLVLDRLPTNASGKADYSMLPEILLDSSEDDLGFAGPANEFEEVVAQVWRSQMQLGRIGIHDHFLELGGDSLVAARVTVRLSEHYGMKIPRDILFECPTIATLAAEIAARIRKEQTSDGEGGPDATKEELCQS